MVSCENHLDHSDPSHLEELNSIKLYGIGRINNSVGQSMQEMANSSKSAVMDLSKRLHKPQ